MLDKCRKHPLELAHPRSTGERASSVESVYRRQKLSLPKRTSTAELGLSAGVYQLVHPANVIVVPVSGDDQLDCLRRVDAHAQKVIQRLGFPRIVDAGIDDEPATFSDVYYDALAVAWPQQRNFDLVIERCAL